MAGGGGGSGDSGQPLLAGMLTAPTKSWQGGADPLGLLIKPPPDAQPFPFEQSQLPEMTPQDTDRLAFLKAFGVQG